MPNFACRSREEAEDRWRRATERQREMRRRRELRREEEARRRREDLRNRFPPQHKLNASFFNSNFPIKEC